MDDTVEVVFENVQVIAAAGSVGVSTAPVHGRARRELFVAEESAQNSVEIPTVHESMTDETLRKLETIIDALSPLKGLQDLAVRMENFVADVEHVAPTAQWTNMAPLLIRVKPFLGSGVKSSLSLRSWRIQALGRTTSMMLNSSDSLLNTDDEGVDGVRVGNRPPGAVHKYRAPSTRLFATSPYSRRVTSPYSRRVTSPYSPKGYESILTKGYESILTKGYGSILRMGTSAALQAAGYQVLRCRH